MLMAKMVAHEQLIAPAVILESPTADRVAMR